MTILPFLMDGWIFSILYILPIGSIVRRKSAQKRWDRASYEITTHGEKGKMWQLRQPYLNNINKKIWQTKISIASIGMLQALMESDIGSYSNQGK